MGWTDKDFADVFTVLATLQEMLHPTNVEKIPEYADLLYQDCEYARERLGVIAEACGSR